MTLEAPEHLRGKLCNFRPALLDEREAWIKKAVAAGFTTDDLADALGISRSAASDAKRRAGIPSSRKPSTPTASLRAKGILTGWPCKTIDAMPAPAREVLERHAARTGKPMVAILAEFWAEHHGERA